VRTRTARVMTTLMRNGRDRRSGKPVRARWRRGTASPVAYGPPGSGKSHAVGKLTSALGWPVFEINLGELGSPYVHQTSVALRRTFEEAKSKAPAIVLLEEIDALASVRGPMTHDHKVEEVTELLRLVERASANNVLVIATTNRREALDAAILRKGRFDHSIEVGYPTDEEVCAALEAMLDDRPHRDIPNLRQLGVKLAGRPMSDIAWTINEAARLAARGKKDAIDEIDLFSALKRLRV
jgi:cell division protease FtsH